MAAFIKVARLLTLLLVVFSGAGAPQSTLARTTHLLVGDALSEQHSSCQGLEKDKTSWKVFLAIKKGKLTVDRKRTTGTFVPSELFKCRAGTDAKGTSVQAVERELMADLDTLFLQLPDVYKFSLQNDEVKNPPVDALTRQLLLDYTWNEFQTKYGEWVQEGKKSGKDRISLKRIFSPSEILRQVTALKFNTPMFFQPDKKPRPYDFDEGSITVDVSDPIGDWQNSEDYDFLFPDVKNAEQVQKNREGIIKELNGLRGRLWRPTTISKRIEEYYSYRGLQATVSVRRDVGTSKLLIEIYESPRIARILFHRDVPASEYDKLLYVLLPYEYYHAYLDRKPSFDDLKVTSEQADGTVTQEVLYRALDYCKLYPCAGDEPYINQLVFQIQQLELSELGFVASQSESPSEIRLDAQSEVNTYIDLIILKADKTEGQKQSQPSAVPSAPLITNEEGVARSRLDADPEHVRSEMVTPAPLLDDPVRDGGKKENDRSWVPKEKTKFLGFGIEYSPGQNVRLFGIYQQSKLGFLSSNDSVSFKAGAQESGLGGLNYYADYVLFNHLKRRLTLQITGNTDFQANRLFFGIATDERRSGGLVRGELELFRNRHGSLLRLHAEGRQATVTLSRNDSTVSKVNLTTLEFGGFFLSEARAAYRPRQFKLDFAFRLGLPKSESAYRLFSLSGNYHKLLTRFLETDVSGRVETASEDTPIFDQPSFGGSDVVRGFRRDDLIGLNLWSLQPELWFPVPGTTAAESGIKKFLQRQVRLAGFFDVGGVYRTGTSKNGIKVGPGIGARLIFFPVIMKLDWAYGIGETVTGKGRGRFYFTVGTNLPF